MLIDLQNGAEPIWPQVQDWSSSRPTHRVLPRSGVQSDIRKATSALSRAPATRSVSVPHRTSHSLKLTVVVVPTCTPLPTLESASSTLSTSNEDTGALQLISSLQPLPSRHLAPHPILQLEHRPLQVRAICQVAVATPREADRPVGHRQLIWIHHTTYPIDDKQNHRCKCPKTNLVKLVVQIRMIRRRYLKSTLPRGSSMASRRNKGTSRPSLLLQPTQISRVPSLITMAP